MGNCCVAPIDKTKYVEKNQPVFERLEHEFKGENNTYEINNKTPKYFSGDPEHPDDRLKEELKAEFGIFRKGNLANIEVKIDNAAFKSKLGKIAKAQKKAVDKALKDDFTVK